MNAYKRSFILEVVLALAVFAVSEVAAQNEDVSNAAARHGNNATVSITPIGQRTGEYCARDRALLFEDPTGIRILYDPGVTVSGGADPRLGAVDAILVSHNHFDHLGYRKLKQNPDDPQANCGILLPSQTTATGNTTTAEIAAFKNSAVLVNGSMAVFLSTKIQTIRGVATPSCPSSDTEGLAATETVVPLGSPCALGLAFGSLRILTRAAGAPGVRINMVSALHSDSLFNPVLLFTPPLGGLGAPSGQKGELDQNGLQGYDGLANGFVLTFTNGLRVYLTGDTGPTSDMALIVRGIYHPNLAVANMDALNNMGPEEAAYAMKELVQPVAVIPSHAEEAVTVNGQLRPGTRTGEFIRLLGDTPAYLPLSGHTMQFDRDAHCVAGCSQNRGRGID